MNKTELLSKLGESLHLISSENGVRKDAANSFISHVTQFANDAIQHYPQNTHGELISAIARDFSGHAITLSIDESPEVISQLCSHYSLKNSNGFVKSFGEKIAVKMRNWTSDLGNNYVLQIQPKVTSSNVATVSINANNIGDKFSDIITQHNLSDDSLISISKLSVNVDPNGLGEHQSKIIHEVPISFGEAKGFNKVEELISAAEIGDVGAKKGFTDSIKNSNNKGWIVLNAGLGAMFLYQAVEGFRQDRSQKTMQSELTGQPKPTVFNSLTMGTLMSGLFSGISFASAAAIINNGRGH